MRDFEMHDRGTRSLLADLSRQGAARPQDEPRSDVVATLSPATKQTSVRRWWRCDLPIRFPGESRAALRSRPALAPLCALALAVATLPGCGESKMTLDGTMKGEMRGDLAGTFRIEGPIEIQMRGPTIRYEGVYISDKLLERVDTGKTTIDWLIAVMGEPTHRANLNDGSEVWKWAYTPMEQEGSIVSFFGGGEKEEPSLQPSTAFVRVKDGVAVEKWRD